MRDYEVVYIFRPELESEEVDARLEDVHARLEGEITAVEHWGQRKLAFEIKGERSGYYVVTQFRAEPGSLSDFEQGLKHDEQLIRHLIVLSEGEMPTPPSQRREEDEEDEAADEAGEPSEEDEDEEDEEDEEVDEDDEGDDEEDEEDEEVEEDEGDDEEDGVEEDDGDDDDQDEEK